MNSSNLPSASHHCFTFQKGQSVRVVIRGLDPWFVATDVCSALGIKNATQSMAALDPEERSMFSIGRQGLANIVSESGLYTLILRCRSATTPGTIAHRFRKWVTSEVLPAIRRSGSYSTPKPEAELGSIADFVLNQHKLSMARYLRVTPRILSETMTVGLSAAFSDSPDHLQEERLPDLLSAMEAMHADAYRLWLTFDECQRALLSRWRSGRFVREPGALPAAINAMMDSVDVPQLSIGVTAGTRAAAMGMLEARRH